MLFMSSAKQKLEFILENISNIEEFKTKYKTTEALLNDSMGYNATLMCLFQIGETLHKLRDESFADKLPIKGTYDVRNFIAHDYEGVNKVIIEDIMRLHLPQLKKDIESILIKI